MRLGSGYGFDPQRVGQRAYKVELDRRDFALLEAWCVGATFPLELRLTFSHRQGAPEEKIVLGTGGELKQFLKGLKLGLGV